MKLTKKKILAVAIIVLIVFYISAKFTLSVTRIISRAPNIYKYDVTTNYVYNFHDKSSKNVKIRVFKDHFTWPELKKSWDTAFIKMEIKSDRLGSIFEPYIEMISGGTTISQYFERGVNGVRYLNVSGLLPENTASGQKVILKGEYLSWEEQDADLILFHNPDIHDARVLILAPHPDDAELAAFGLYSGSDSYIVTLTAGDARKEKYEYFFPDKKTHSLETGEIRVWDSITVPFLGGVPASKAINLGYFDRTFEDMYNTKDKEISAPYSGISDINTFRQHNLSEILKGSSGRSIWASLVGDLKYIIEEVRPDIIVAPQPVLDYHPDHEFGTVALLEALEQTGIEKGFLYLYIVHSKIADYYPFGSPRSAVSLPPSFNGNIYFWSVLSYPLDVDKQNRKLFALEAMHDLRPSPDNLLPKKSWDLDRFLEEVNLVAMLRDIVRLPARRIKRALRSSTRGTNSYFRKAVRSNELFFVYPFNDSEKILDNFLDTKAAGADTKKPRALYH